MMAFVISRLLLIATDLHAFLSYPLLMLGLPSLTYGGMALTAAATLLYLRRRRLPVLAVLDAWSPSAAVLAAALALGHFLEGTDPGMPSTLPWAVRVPGWHLRMQPSQLYAMVAALALGVMLLVLLAQPHRAGAVLRVGLVAGGAIGFGLQMLTQPEAFPSGLLLEPGQWIALGALIAGVLLFVLRRHPEAERKAPHWRMQRKAAPAVRGR